MKKSDLIFFEGTFIGINLGLCESEITNFCVYFGIDCHEPGTNSRKIQKFPYSTVEKEYTMDFVQSGNKFALLYNVRSAIEIFKKDPNYIMNLRMNVKENLKSYWNDYSFGIVTTDYYKELDAMFRAFVNLDIIFVLSTDQNSFLGEKGLVILIASRLPKAMESEFLTMDLKKKMHFILS